MGEQARKSSAVGNSHRCSIVSFRNNLQYRRFPLGTQAQTHKNIALSRHRKSATFEHAPRKSRRTCLAKKQVLRQFLVVLARRRTPPRTCRKLHENQKQKTKSPLIPYLFASYIFLQQKTRDSARFFLTRIPVNATIRETRTCPMFPSPLRLLAHKKLQRSEETARSI